MHVTQKVGFARSPEPAPAKPAYGMPTVGLGALVFWYGGRGGTPPVPAFVSALGTDMVDLNVLVPDSGTFLCRGGVRHRSDPNKQAIDNADVGVWDYSDEARGILALIAIATEQAAALRALTRQVAELQAARLAASQPPANVDRVGDGGMEVSRSQQCGGFGDERSGEKSLEEHLAEANVTPTGAALQSDGPPDYHPAIAETERLAGETAFEGKNRKRAGRVRD